MAITRANLVCSGIVSTILVMFIFAGCIPTVNSTLTGTMNSDLRCDKDNMTERGPEMNMLQNQTLSIRGKLDLSSSHLELKPSMILPSSQFTPIPANRTFTINLVDKNQDELAIFPFDLIISNATSSNNKTDDRALISAAVPYHACTAKIILKMNDRELAYQSVSPHKPDIKSIGIDTDFNKNKNNSMLFPRTTNISVNWDAQDLDGDNITYSLLYSYDGGLTWDTVIDYTSKKSFTVPGDSLQGNTVNLSKFRLIATDDVNTDIKDSDPFSIPALTLGH